MINRPDAEEVLGRVRRSQEGRRKESWEHANRF